MKSGEYKVSIEHFYHNQKTNIYFGFGFTLAMR